MDLAKYNTSALEEEGAFLHLEGPEGERWMNEEGEPIGVTLLSINSKRIREVVHKQQNRRLSKARVGRRGHVTGITSEAAESDALEVLAAATVSFSNLEWNGAPVTAEHAFKVYSKFHFIREQVDEFINEESHWLGEVSTS